MASPPARSDFRRGKRYKKLQVLLASKQNMEVLNRFQLHSFIVVGALMVAHLGCFIALEAALTKTVSRGLLE